MSAGSRTRPEHLVARKNRTVGGDPDRDSRSRRELMARNGRLFPPFLGYSACVFRGASRTEKKCLVSASKYKFCVTHPKHKRFETYEIDSRAKNARNITFFGFKYALFKPGGGWILFAIRKIASRVSEYLPLASRLLFRVTKISYEVYAYLQVGAESVGKAGLKIQLDQPSLLITCRSRRCTRSSSVDLPRACSTRSWRTYGWYFWPCSKASRFS